MEDNLWLLATLAAALCWGVADILCDICIGEDDEEDEDGYELVALSNQDSGDDSSRGRMNSKELPGAVQEKLNGASSSADKSQTFGGHAEVDTAEALTGRAGQDLKKRRCNSGSDPGRSPVSEPQIASVVSVPSAQTDPVKDNHIKTDSSVAPSEDSEEGEHLDGVQDCAIAGLTTMTVMYGLALRRVHHQASISFNSGQSAGQVYTGETPLLNFLWSPTDDIEWWMATCSGSLMFIHYLFLLMAFDSAPSTVINPLIQVSSTWMLFGSAVPALLTGSTFIRPLDLLCYVIIVIGGILPSLDGNFKRMLTAKFWQQRFVRNTVISEVAVGIYDLVMSYCLQTSGKKEKFREISPADLEFEFFFIAWCGFVVSFCITFAMLPAFRQRFIDLRLIPRRIIILSGIGQALTLLGYYASQFAYSWYYQASIVHAAEASLSQACNLLFAFIALKCFGLGRESSIDNLRIKIFSCLIVSAGLFLLSLSESEEEALVAEAPFKTEDILNNLDLDSQLDLGLLPSGNALRLL